MYRIRMHLACVNLAICFLLVPLGGCSPRTVVKKDPLPSDSGIRFYRPRPYLLVSPSAGNSPNAGSEVNSVDLQIQYLPDYAEEYSIDFRPGIGINQTQIDLENGWNLVGLNSKLESGASTLASSTAELVGAIGGVAKMRQTQDKGSVPGVKNVSATNVLFGYYRSVIKNVCGKKRLVGWQYVGFLPFGQTSCCEEAGSANCHCSVDSFSDQRLFGLTTENGIIVFKPMDEIGAGIFQDLPPVQKKVEEAPPEQDLSPSFEGSDSDRPPEPSPGTKPAKKNNILMHRIREDFRQINPFAAGIKKTRKLIQSTVWKKAPNALNPAEESEKLLILQHKGSLFR